MTANAGGNERGVGLFDAICGRCDRQSLLGDDSLLGGAAMDVSSSFLLGASGELLQLWDGRMGHR